MGSPGQQEFDFDDSKGQELEETKRVIDNMDAVLINGTQLLLNFLILSFHYFLNQQKKACFCYIDTDKSLNPCLYNPIRTAENLGHTAVCSYT